jgi:NaMN:DMB phosphoribosyltransferase
MSRAAKGHEKYGKEGMAALAKAGREGAGEKKLDSIRDKHDKYNESRQVSEMATGGGSSAGGIATSMGGPGHKPTSGVPKKLGNAAKMKKVAVGKGVY